MFSNSIPTSPVVSVMYKAFDYEMVKKTNESATKIPDNSRGKSIFVLTKDGSIYVIDGNNGSMISSMPAQLKKSTAISMYLIEGHLAVSSSVDERLQKDDILKSEPVPSGGEGSEKCETEDRASDGSSSDIQSKGSCFLLCCRDSLLIYPTKSVFQGQSKSICKVKLSKPCCWTTVFRTDHVVGLAVFFQTGEMEIRSLPDLELVKEFSLLSELRWNFKPNMERMISSVENLHIALTNGCEVAFVSLLEGQNDFRIPESLPSLHDEVLAAAANAAISISSHQKRKQGGNPGILSGIVKGLKAPKPNKPMYHDPISKADFSHLEEIFMRKTTPEPLSTTDDPEAIELTIDDIDIDEPGPSASTSSLELDNKSNDKKSEREKLFDDGDAEIKPRLRTREEIVAKYRKAGDASSAAAQAKSKLLERQEKLEKISRRTEDLRNGAEDFASLANELAKAMEKRKWYHM